MLRWKICMAQEDCLRPQKYKKVYPKKLEQEFCADFKAAIMALIAVNQLFVLRSIA
jgi:hypothetical protein